MKKICILLVLISISFSYHSNVNVTKPTININACPFPSAYSALGNIVIDEGANGDFGLAAVSTNYTLILTAPANFQFSPGVGAVAASATGDITAISIVVTATTVTITYQSNEGNRVNEDDIVTISGLQVRTTAASGSVDIYRTAGSPGTGVIAGITNNATSFGTMSSLLTCGCLHTLRMTDLNGDSWDGGYVDLRINGVYLRSAACVGSGPTDITFYAQTSDIITVVKALEDYSGPGTMRVEVLDVNGTTVIARQDPNSAGISGTGNCAAPVAMAISSATVTQSSATTASKCAGNVQIVRLEITTTGNAAAKTVTQIQTNFTGTSGVGALSNVDIYYTGNSSIFTKTSLFGSNASPSTSTYNINGSQTLNAGVNYFWLVYDLNNTGTIGNTIDGVITQFTASAVNYNSGSTPNISTTNPAGTIALTLCVTPGGVTNGLETWLKANSGVTGTTPITDWANQNGAGTDVLVNGAPNLNTASTSYNYNPYVDFTAPAGTLGCGTAANRQFLKLNGNNAWSGFDYKSLFFTQNLTDLSRLYTHLATIENVSLSGPVNGTLHGSVDVSNTIAAFQLDPYDSDFDGSSPAGTWQKNGTNVTYNSNHSTTKNIISANATTGGATTVNRFFGGQSDDWTSFFQGHYRDWKGPVAELIGFTNTLTATERQKVNSYLAVKYGVTLSINYLSTSGGTIFTTTSPYNNNIIGIGRDDAEDLTQKQSHNDSDTVRIYLSSLAATNSANAGTFASDISYVMTGANTGKMSATTASNAEIPTGLTNCAIFSRIAREWKVTKTNMAGNFNMDFKLNSISSPSSVNVAHLRLLVDDDGNFANGGTQCYYNGDGSGLVFTYSNPTITVSNISNTHIPNNATKYITIASINAATPLPIEIIVFDAKLNQKNMVDLTWETETEINNDYFTIDRSTDAIHWESLGEVDGSGTTNTPKSYYLEDKYPSMGINYYRLKQTNFNGTFNYVDIKSVNLINESNYFLYPNPSSDYVTIFGSNLDDEQVQVIDNLGQYVEFDVNLKTPDQMEINTSKFAKGIYYVKISAANKRTILKLSIVK